MSLPTKPTSSSESVATNSHAISGDTEVSSEALFFCRASDVFLGPLPSPLKSPDPFVQRAPVPRDAALIPELSAALEKISIDCTNGEEPRVKKVTWDDNHAAKQDRSKQHSQPRSHSITHPTAAETKSNWRSGSRDPQFKGSSSFNWRPTCNAKSDMNVASGSNKGRSRGNYVSTGISAERRVKQRPTEGLNLS